MPYLCLPQGIEHHMPSFPFGVILFSCVLQPIEFNKQSGKKYDWRIKRSEAKLRLIGVVSDCEVNF